VGGVAYGDVQDGLTAEDQERLTRIQVWRAENPRAAFAAARAKGPLAFDESAQGAVEVLNREDIEWVLRNPAIFSSAVPIMGSEEPVIPVGTDAPLHTEYRHLLDPALSPRRMAALQPSVAAHTNRLIDEVVEQGTVDFSRHIAVPLPCLTFLDLLGVPHSELDRLLYWKDVMIASRRIAPTMEERMRIAAAEAPKIYAYLYALIADRREHPTGGDDLITRLMETSIEGGARTLSDNEIARCLFQLIAAGLDTVTITLECILNHLASHPDDLRMVAEDPDTLENLIEELLRWETPVQSTAPRRATVDTEIAGCPIKAGTIVSAVIAAGNLDPAFGEQETVDVRRGDKRHLAFGGGPHRCLGSHLARMELRTVVREWVRRVPEFGYPDGYAPEWNASPMRGIESLQLAWNPATTRQEALA
jgi:cytochrome P450